MKKLLKANAILLCIAAASVTQAADTTGKLGVNYTVGPSFVVGGDRAKEDGRVGPQVGAGLEYGLLPMIAATVAYDDLEQGFNTQAFTFGGTFRPLPQNSLSPFVNAGMGFGHRYSGDGWDHFALKLSGGVEHFFTGDLSAAALLSYYYVNGDDDGSGFKSVHTITPGVRMTYYFGATK